MEPANIVVDTNVFVGALLGGDGANRRVIRLCLKNRARPVMGTALLLEYEGLLARDGLFDNHRLNAAERDELLNAFLSVCRWVSINYLWRPNLPDEADNHVVELAAAGNASVIVTNNVRDFVGPQMEFLGVQAMRPVDYLKQLEAAR